MCASVKCYIRACLLESGADHQQEETTIDGQIIVDGINLLGWHYKDNGWGESAKRPRCVPQVEGERVEEESQMAAQ